VANTQPGSIQDVIAAVPAITALLATYNGVPAIFTAPPIPEDANLPAVVIEMPIAEGRVESKTTRGIMTTRDVNIYVDHQGSVVVLETLVDLVKKALHRKPVSWSGYAGWKLAVVRDAEAPTDDRILGRSLTVEVRAEEV